MSEFSEIIIILRFRDLVTKENDTIKQHQEIIQQHGSVWWGWWKKGTEKTPCILRLDSATFSEIQST